MDPVIIALLAKYGVNVVVDVLEAWQQAGEPSLEDIKKLRDIEDPEEYFKDAQQL